MNTKPQPVYQQSEPYTDDYMDDSRRAYFRLLLCNWKQELVTEDAGLTSLVKGDVSGGITREAIADPLDVASQDVELLMELRTLGRLRKLVKKIDSSIAQIDHNDYGYCDTCGIAIGLKRLEARPTATQCIDCKNLEELKARQMHG